MNVHKGLEGVIADTSAVSLVEGLSGELSYRGYTIGSLVNQPFAAVYSRTASSRVMRSLSLTSSPPAFRPVTM